MESLFEIKSLSEEKHFNDAVFPLTCSPKSEDESLNDILDKIQKNRDLIADTLVKHGAILFRGFPVKDACDLNEFILRFGWKDMPYLGGIANRSNIVGVVHTANETTNTNALAFHHEMASLPIYATHLFFFCDVPPRSGGETPILVSNVAYEKIKERLPEFVEELKRKGVIYNRVMPSDDDYQSEVGRSWQKALMTSDKSEAEEKCKDLYEKIEWLADGSLSVTSKIMDPIRLDPRINKLTWFNNVVATYLAFKDSRNDSSRAVRYGDNSIIDSKIIDECFEIMKENRVAFKWQRGDILLIDNLLVLHSRNEFEPPRRILVGLCNSNS